jgi:hypothetical protein
MPHQEQPFWHFNVPVDQRTPDCPDYLLNLSDKDRGLIGKWDADYEPMTWDEVQSVVSTSAPPSTGRTLTPQTRTSSRASTAARRNCVTTASSSATSRTRTAPF